MKKVTIFVSNDLNTDQRMQRIAISLAEAGWKVELVGVLRAHSLPFSHQTYQVTRLLIRPQKGILFYVALNIRYLTRALGTKTDVLLSVDLDTLPAIRVAAWLRSKIIVWDCHELFTEMPELVHRPRIQRVWKYIARTFIPGLTHVMTVTQGVAQYLLNQFKVNSILIHNYPSTFQDDISVKEKYDSKIIFFQGILNQGRGLDILIQACKELPEGYHLEIAGDGPQRFTLEAMVAELDLKAKVKFLGLMSPDELKVKTRCVFLGLSLLDARHENSRISLANKNLDYIMGGIPAITMDFPEYRSINEKWEVALLLQEATVETVRHAMLELIHDYVRYEQMYLACLAARKVLCWEHESPKLSEFFYRLKGIEM